MADTGRFGDRIVEVSPFCLMNGSIAERTDGGARSDLESSPIVKRIRELLAPYSCFSAPMIPPPYVPRINAAQSHSHSHSHSHVRSHADNTRPKVRGNPCGDLSSHGFKTVKRGRDRGKDRNRTSSVVADGHRGGDRGTFASKAPNNKSPVSRPRQQNGFGKNGAREREWNAHKAGGQRSDLPRERSQRERGDGGAKDRQASGVTKLRRSDDAAFLGILNRLNASNYVRLSAQALMEIEKADDENAWVRFLDLVLDKCCTQSYYVDVFVRMITDVVKAAGERNSDCSDNVRNRLVSRIREFCTSFFDDTLLAKAERQKTDDPNDPEDNVELRRAQEDPGAPACSSAHPSFSSDVDRVGEPHEPPSSVESRQRQGDYDRVDGKYDRNSERDAYDRFCRDIKARAFVVGANKAVLRIGILFDFPRFIESYSDAVCRELKDVHEDDGVRFDMLLGLLLEACDAMTKIRPMSRSVRGGGAGHDDKRRDESSPQKYCPRHLRLHRSYSEPVAHYHDSACAERCYETALKRYERAADNNPASDICGNRCRFRLWDVQEALKKMGGDRK